MKKFLFTVVSSVVIFFMMAHYNDVLSALQWLQSPRIHTVQQGEYLSKLAQENYGNASYWRELALVNRAPNPDHVQVGEQILLPSANVIQELRRSRTLTRVNSLVGEQEVAATIESLDNTYVGAEPAESTEPIAASASEEQATSAPVVEQASYDGAYPPAQSEQIEPAQEASDASWFWLVVSVVAFSGVVGFVIYRRRREKEVDVEVTVPRNGGDNEDFSLDRRTPSVTQQPYQETTV